MKGATVRKELALLQHAFEIARKECAIPLRNNPVASIRKLQADRPRDRRLLATKYARLVEACDRSRNAQIKPLLTATRLTDVL